MQKVLRINLNARNQALQKARRAKLKSIKTAWSEHEAGNVYIDREFRKLVKTERKNRREDWIAGPLAPRRDVGLNEGLYGTLKADLLRRPELPAEVSRWPKSKGWDEWGGEGAEDENPIEWEGYGNEGNIVKGDRVCVVRGHDSIRGKIGKVKEVREAQREVIIEDVNKVDVELPEEQPQRKFARFNSMEMGVPIDDIRLVYRRIDHHPTTGRVLRDRDVIVNLIRGGAPYIQREFLSPLPRHTRYVAGEDVEIEWPHDPGEEFVPFAGDTVRYDLEVRTYTPYLYQQPLPKLSILDELRPKYRIDRAWHEEEYTRMKILADARSKWYEERSIDTPAMELQKKLRQESEQREMERRKQVAQQGAVERALAAENAAKKTMLREAVDYEGEPEEVDPSAEAEAPESAYEDLLDQDVIVHDAPAKQKINGRPRR